MRAPVLTHSHPPAAVSALLALLGCTPPLAAQPANPAVSTYCRVEAANEPPPDAARPDLLRPMVVYERFSPLIERNEWGTIGKTLADDFRESKASLPAEMREKFQRQLDGLKADMQKGEDSPNPTDFFDKAKGVRQIRFQITQSATEAETFDLFPATSDRIIITPAVGPAVARELCYRAHAAQKILIRYGQNAREHTSSVLGYYVTLWDRYNTNGYSQYPWQLYLNGHWPVKEDQWQPPRGPWVVGHPAIAIETTWPQSRDLRRLDIISLEAVGYLRFNKHRTSYFGASALMTLAASSGVGC